MAHVFSLYIISAAICEQAKHKTSFHYEMTGYHKKEIFFGLGLMFNSQITKNMKKTNIFIQIIDLGIKY